MTLLDRLNQSHYNFYFLVVDPFLDILAFPQLTNFHLIYAQPPRRLSLIKKQKHPYFCLANHDKNLVKNSGKLLSHPKVISYIKKTCRQNQHQPAIILFKPSAKIDHLCRRQNWIKIGNSAKIARPLEDKIKFSQFCHHHQLPQTPHHIAKFSQTSYQQQPTPTGLVIQTHFGWAGKSSYFSTNWSDIKNKITAGTSVKYSPYLPDSYTLTNNCCLSHQGLIQSPPARQITGIKPLTTNPLASVGRQWPCLAPPNAIAKIQKITQEFGRILHHTGFKGFFGLDFLINHQQVYLQECNPRLTASFAHYTKIESKNNITPLFYIHLATFLALDQDINLPLEQNRFHNPHIIGFQLNQKNQQGETIDQINRFDQITLNPTTINKLFHRVPLQ